MVETVMLGKCVKCGNCCRETNFIVGKPTEDEIKLWMLKGFRIRQLDNGDTLVTVIAPCKHLLPDNTCAIYENRPEYCKKWPTLEDVPFIPASCGFHYGWRK